VYEDRPAACRYYPVALLSMRRQDEYTDTQSYTVVMEDHCLGHNEPRSLTIDEYRKEQGLEEYDELARCWRHHPEEKVLGAQHRKPPKRSLQLFFMVCYDIDTFHDFVTSEGFTSLYALPADETEKIFSDDAALMLFGFRFLRQVLFGENSIAMKDDAAEKRRKLVHARAEQIQREAREKLAAQQDDMYGGEED
jgi:uncharacterized protein